MITTPWTSLRAEVRLLASSLGKEIVTANGPRILMYHRVCNSKHRLAVDPDLFRRHLDYLQENEITVLSVRDLLDRLGEPDLNAVALSFDDGYSEMSSLVSEELKCREMGATFFVLPRFANYPQEISPEAKFSDGGNCFLGLEEIINLHQEGFEIGAHGLTHRSLTRIPDRHALDEIYKSRLELNSLLGTEVRGFAYPRGHYSPIHRAQVAASGFHYGVSVQPGYLKLDQATFDLPRTEVAGGDTPVVLNNKLNGGLDIWHSLLQRIKGNSEGKKKSIQ